MKRRRPSAEPRQGELFRASTTWFHVLHAMIQDGTCAALGPHAMVVYLVIKAHADFHTGMAFPSTAVIADKAGVCRRKVAHALRILQEAGFLTIERRGRRNHYRLREQVGISNAGGEPAAVAAWDYRPTAVKSALEQLKAMLTAGTLNAGPDCMVMIKKLNMTVQINAGPGVQIVAADGGSDDE